MRSWSGIGIGLCLGLLCSGIGRSAEADWTILYAGNRLGTLEPCSCIMSEAPGGVDREAWLIDQFRKDTPATIVLDVGGLTGTPGAERPARIRLVHAYMALTAIGYDAINVGHGALSAGVDSIVRWRKQYRVPLVSANVVDAQGKPIFDTFRILELRTKAGEPIRLGVTGVTAARFIAGSAGSALSEDALSRSPAPGVRIENMFDRLPAVLEAMRVQCDVTVVLCDGGKTAAQAIAQRLKPDVVLTNVFGPPTATREASGIVGESGLYGRALGRLDLSLEVSASGDATPRLQLRQAIPFPISAGAKRSPELKKLLNDFLLVQARALSQMQREAQGRKISYMGAESCRSCHAGPWEHWRTTAHAGAYDALVKRGETDDDLQLARAVTGYRRLGGFVSAERSGDLGGVQCEACHGPGKDHVRDHLLLKARAGLPLQPESQGAPPIAMLLPDEVTCLSCHDRETDPDFEYEAALKRVRHPRPQAPKGQANDGES